MIDLMDKSRRVGFSGLGSMGYGMALNLLKDGFDVIGFDVFEAPRDRFKTAGGLVASSVSESCKGTTRW